MNETTSSADLLLSEWPSHGMCQTCKTLKIRQGIVVNQNLLGHIKAYLQSHQGTINLFGDKQLISLGVGAENLTRFDVFSQHGRGRIAHSLPGGISLALPGVSNAQGLPGRVCTGTSALYWDKWVFSCPS